MRIASTCALTLTLGAAAPTFAEVSVSAGIEYFSWTEDTDPINVKERGPLAVLGLDFTQNKARGLALAYRGRLYAGTVDYEGALLFLPDIPVSSDTRYRGMSHEGQLRWRSLLSGSVQADFVGGLGADLWERKLGSNQQEDYRIFYARLGLEFSAPRGRGWTAGFGLKYPFDTWEDANLRDEGYDQNPKLEPKGRPSLYANLGYRFNRRLGVQLYLDGFRFDESDPIVVTGFGDTFAFVQPKSTQYNVGLRLHWFF